MALTASKAADAPSLLLVMPTRVGELILDRAATLTDVLGADLHVFCPIVAPPAPHSGTTPGAPAMLYDERAARAEARRLAGSMVSSFNERRVDAQVETGICHSLTAGVLDAADRLRPDLLLLVKQDDPGLFEQPFAMRVEEVWSRLDIPVWLMDPADVAYRRVMGLIAADPDGRRGTEDDDRVARTAAMLASRMQSDVHLLSCVHHVLALSPARTNAVPRLASLSERKEGRVVRRLHEIADRYGIDRAHVHLHHGAERDMLEQMAEPMEIGIVVTGEEPRRMLGGLLKRPRAAKLVDLHTDLLVLGDTDVPYA